MSAEPTDPYAPPTAAVERPRPTGRRHLNFVGFLPRLMAILLDSVWLVLLSFGLSYMIVGGWDFLDPDFVGGMSIFAAQNILPMVLILAFWNSRGATPGKILLGLKIVNYRTGEPASFGQLLGRYLAYIPSGMVLGLGYFWVIWDKEKRSWHDKLSGTAVVRS